MPRLDQVESALSGRPTCLVSLPTLAKLSFSVKVEAEDSRRIRPPFGLGSANGNGTRGCPSCAARSEAISSLQSPFLRWRRNQDEEDGPFGTGPVAGYAPSASCVSVPFSGGSKTLITWTSVSALTWCLSFGPTT